MRKIRKNVVLFFMTCIMFGSNIVSYAAETETDAEVEAEELEYYMLYMMDADNNMTIEVGRREVIMEQSDHNIDLYNLTLFQLETGVYHPFQMAELETGELTREVREYLLYAGYAKINDDTIAQDYELEAQEHAKSNGLGGWSEPLDESGESLDKSKNLFRQGPVRIQEEHAERKAFSHKQKEELKAAIFFTQKPIKMQKEYEEEQGASPAPEEEIESENTSLQRPVRTQEECAERQGELYALKEKVGEPEETEELDETEEPEETDIWVLVKTLSVELINQIKKEPKPFVICCISFLIIVWVIKKIRKN